MRDTDPGIHCVEFDKRPQRTLGSAAAASAQSSLSSSSSSNNNNNNIESNAEKDTRDVSKPGRGVSEKRTMKEEGGGVRGWMSMLFAGANSTTSSRSIKKSRRKMKKENNTKEEAERVSNSTLAQNEDEEDSYEFELSERLNRERQVTNNSRTTTNQDVYQQVKSPLVEQFINSHKLQWSSSNSSTCSSLSLGSLCELSPTNQLQLNETAQELLLGKRRSPRPNRNEMEVEVDVGKKEHDDRLIGWRLLAARASYLNGLSLDDDESSDSELELLHCQGPAEADDCSDDTSCSSVELVWTRPRQSLPQTTIATPEVVAPTLATKCAQQHQFSVVLELAKPSKAKGRFMGKSQRRAKESKRSSGDSGENANTQKWVANPLFSSSEELEQFQFGDQEEKRYQSCESLVVVAKEEEAPDDEEEEAWLERDSRKRWSLRGKSPFSISRDNIYLNQLRSNLRSNVSNIRSQLSVKISDTSKRASVLADQLLASIKDTTKELVVGPNEPDENEGENSFAGGNNQQDAGCHHSETTAVHKNKMFSLIYQHQQQANGQTVITRQPRSAGSLNHHQNPSFSAVADAQEKSLPTTSPVAVVAPKEETITNNNDEQCDKEACDVKSLRRRLQTSRRFYRSKSDDDDDDDELNGEDFFKAEYDKVKATTSVGRRTRLRSLNYWRRFRLRHQRQLHSNCANQQLSTSY